MQRLKNYWEDSILRPCRELSPESVTIAGVAGAFGGVFPIPMCSTFAVVLLSNLLHLSAPQLAVAMAVNVLVTPLQLALIPFLATSAAAVTSVDASNFNMTFLKRSLEMGFVYFLQACAAMVVHGVLMWLILAVPVVITLKLWVSRISNAKEETTLVASP